MCSWNLTENIGTKWDFPSKIKSLEIKDYPKHWKAKGREIINCKLGWIMLFGRVQSFEDELEIPCHSWICDKPLGQMLVLPISGTKAADCSGRRHSSCVENNTLSSTAVLAGSSLSVIQSLQMTSEGTVVCKSPL